MKNISLEYFILKNKIRIMLSKINITFSYCGSFDFLVNIISDLV